MNYQQPQTRIFTQFEASTAIRTSSLAACIVAPYYDVHDGTNFGIYTQGETETVYPYIGLSGDDRVTDADLTNKLFKTVIGNAQVQGYRSIPYSSTEGDAGYLGADGKSLTTGFVVANGGGFSVPAGFPELKIGDVVIHSSDGTDTVCYIAGFQKANATPETDNSWSLPDFNTYGDHSVGDISLTGSQALTTSAVLKIKITSGGTVAASDSPVRASISLDNGAPFLTNVTVGTSAISLSSGGLTLLNVVFESGTNWITDDEITFGLAAPCTSATPYDCGYSVIILDRAISATSGDTFTLYYSAGDVVNPTGATWQSDGLHLAGELSKNGIAIYSGTIKGTYRIRKNEYTGRVYNVTSTGDLTGLVGKIHPMNPLSIMTYLALANSDGSNATFIAVADDSYDAYEQAFDLVGSTNESWSIIPFSEDSAIQELAFAKTQEFCSASVMNWKTGWFGFDVEDETTIMQTLAGTIGSGSDTSSNKLYVNPQTYDITIVEYGDKVIRDGNVYTVQSVITSVQNPYILLDTVLPAGAVSNLKVIRKISAQDKVDLARTYARSFNSELVRVFFADNPYLTSWPEEACPMSYVAAAWAGKRSGVAPHQSLTRSTLTGIACRNTTGFTADQYNQMAEYGVWITVTDNNGSTYCRHQLTTKDTGENYNLKEDSKVSNAHEIFMTYRSGLDAYYGRANVTDTAMELIRLKANEITTNIIGRSWSALLGPQVTEINDIRIEKDPNFSDRVNLYISLATPDPLNNLDVYITIV